MGASGGSNGTHDDSHSPRSTPSSSADLHGHQSPGLSVKTEQVKHEGNLPSGHEAARAQLGGMFDASTEAAMQMAAATANVDPFGGITRGNPLYAGVSILDFYVSEPFLNLTLMQHKRFFSTTLLQQPQCTPIRCRTSSRTTRPVTTTQQLFTNKRISFSCNTYS